MSSDEDLCNSESSIEDDFWLIQINYDHEFLEIDKAPFMVMEETPMSKIHFLFTMLNLDQLFVIKMGVLVGIITKNDFLKKKRMVAEMPTQLPIQDELAEQHLLSIPMHHIHPHRHGSPDDVM